MGVGQGGGKIPSQSYVFSLIFSNHAGFQQSPDPKKTVDEVTRHLLNQAFHSSKANTIKSTIIYQ